MFGLIISGRPVDASPQSVSEGKFAFQIPHNPPFHHIVVFLLPGIQLPPDTAATVYIQIPPSTEFKLLGGIGPGKESAIFKINPGASSNAGPADPGEMMTDGDAGAASAEGFIVVGLSIEPAAQVEAQLATLIPPTVAPPPTALARRGAISGGPVTTKVLAQRIIGNAFNFLASFGSDTVPLKAFRDWWVKFEKKVELDPSFLEREDGG